MYGKLAYQHSKTPAQSKRGQQFTLRASFYLTFELSMQLPHTRHYYQEKFNRNPENLHTIPFTRLAETRYGLFTAIHVLTLATEILYCFTKLTIGTVTLK